MKPTGPAPGRIGAVVALGGLVGFTLHGPWALVGAPTGLLAALAVQRLGGGGAPALLAAALPPLATTGPVAVAPLLALAALEAWGHWQRPWLLGLPALALLAPAPLGPLSAALAAALLAACSPGRWSWLALPAAAAAGASGTGWWVPAAVALGAGAGARLVAAHPANVSMARRVVLVGLAASLGPSAVGLAVSALGSSAEPVKSAYMVAAAAGLLGLLLLSGHVGCALLLRTSEATRAAWMALVWSLPALAAAATFPLEIPAAVALTPNLVGLASVPAGIGLAWSVRLRMKRFLVGPPPSQPS